MGLTLTSLIASGAKPRISEQQRNEKKADYIFLEALSYQNDNKPDAFFSLIEYAHDLNPKDKYVGMQYGLKLMFESGNDSVQFQRGLNYLRDYVQDNPNDFYSALNYVTLLSQYGNDPDEALEAWRKLYENNLDRIEVGGMYAEALTRTADTANVLKAIDIYNDIDRIQGENATVATRKMRLYGALGDTVSVLRVMRELLESSPTSAAYASLAGNLFMELNMRDSALTYYNKAVDLAPTSGIARYQRASYYEAIGDSTKYDAEVFQALTMPDLDIEPKLEILYGYVSKLYSDSIHQPRIESMFQSLVSQYPHDDKVRNLYADYLITIGHYAPAAEQLSYALDSDPSDVKRWNVLASLYFYDNEYDRAMEAVERALKYHPKASNLYSLASSVLVQKHENDSALLYLKKGISITDSTDTDELSTLYCAMGDVFSNDSNPDSAYRVYELSLQYNPENTLALNNFAYMLACQDKELERAHTMIKRVIDNEGGTATTFDTYAWVLFKLKDYAKAHEMIDAALDADESKDGSADILEHAGDIYFMDGSPDKALEFWRKALALKPDNDLLKRKVKHKTFFYK
ncbi:MAG: tetratricopeptide repeat protein [Firmicutes bacterium]|nr:tetratricopeptide repeat protein [Bacillota bacterium]MCM1401147.1 tetratricopeptide repeat protein [Bacteroides sp.]MCM1477030.1 tetratricopeptide repeat protein [Bacteroides sp.]